jgi:hypothetical protein
MIIVAALLSADTTAATMANHEREDGSKEESISA